MSKLSKRREGEIYAAVHHRLVDLRIEVSRFLVGQGEYVSNLVGTRLDTMIAKAQGEASSAAVKAAKGEG